MSSRPAESWGREAAVIIVLAAVTVAAFGRVGTCDFVNFDDDLYVTGNARVRLGLTLEGVRWAFTTLFNCNWHPLTWLSHMLDCQLFGVTAGAHHLVSLALHVLSSCLLFWVFVRMTGSLWRSAVVAGLFAVHPLHVESVAWIAERKDVLSGLLWVLTTWAYVEFVRRRRGRLYVLALLLFSLGIMAKPMVVTLPFVLLLLDLWPLQRLRRESRPVDSADTPKAAHEGRAPVRRASVPAGRGTSFGALVAEKVPFLVLSAFSCVMTFIAQHRGGAAPSFAGLTLDARLANAAVSYVAYLGKLLWPVRLCVFYPFRYAPPALEWVGAVVLLSLISGLVLSRWRKRPYLVVGWAWYLGTLVPVIGLVQVGAQAMADRYMYLPSVGLFLMLAWGAAELAERMKIRAPAVATVTGIVLVALVLRTQDQVRSWADSTALYRRALSVTRHNSRIEKNYGVTLIRLGKLEEAKRYLDDAVRDAPGWGDAYYNRGAAMEALGDFEAATRDYAMAVRLEPARAGAHLRMGSVLFRRGKFDEALGELAAAVRQDPADADARNGLGAALATMGRYREAEEQFLEALELRPGSSFAKENLEKVRALMRNAGGRP